MKQRIFGCSFLALSLAALLSCNDGTNVGTTGSTDSTNTNSDSARMASAGNAVASLTSTYPDTTVNGTVRFETESDGEVKMKLEITVPSKVW